MRRNESVLAVCLPEVGIFCASIALMANLSNKDDFSSCAQQTINDLAALNAVIAFFAMLLWFARYSTSQDNCYCNHQSFYDHREKQHRCHYGCFYLGRAVSVLVCVLPIITSAYGLALCHNHPANVLLISILACGCWQSISFLVVEVYFWHQYRRSREQEPSLAT